MTVATNDRDRGFAFAGKPHIMWSQIYLEDEGAGPPSDYWSFFGQGSPVGIVGVEPGRVIMMTGLHTGTVAFAVAFADRDPGAELDAYEDVVEIDVEAPTGRVFLLECCGAYYSLPALPAGPGTYRLRYHARGMDVGRKLDTNMDPDHPVDEYLLQVWPASSSPPAVRKVTSAEARYWLTRTA